MRWVYPTVVLDAVVIMDAVRKLKGPVATPKRIRFVTEMPLTPVGKINKARLRELMGAEEDK
jgi:acyl-coenzyme A synthetase/AMP-(fatty) acid ligase